MATATTREWLRGAVVAVPTPFHDDFSLDLDALRENIEIMIERGVRTGDGVLLVAGAGGEFPTLTHDERVAVMRASVEAARRSGADGHEHPAHRHARGGRGSPRPPRTRASTASRSASPTTTRPARTTCSGSSSRPAPGRRCR